MHHLVKKASPTTVETTTLVVVSTTVPVVVPTSNLSAGAIIGIVFASLFGVILIGVILANTLGKGGPTTLLKRQYRYKRY